jgi:hypothetical protein
MVEYGLRTYEFSSIVILAYGFNLICKVIYDTELIRQLEHPLGTMCIFAEDYTIMIDIVRQR